MVSSTHLVPYPALSEVCICNKVLLHVHILILHFTFLLQECLEPKFQIDCAATPETGASRLWTCQILMSIGFVPMPLCQWHKHECCPKSLGLVVPSPHQIWRSWCMPLWRKSASWPVSKTLRCIRYIRKSLNV